MVFGWVARPFVSQKVLLRRVLVLEADVQAAASTAGCNLFLLRQCYFLHPTL